MKIYKAINTLLLLTALIGYKTVQQEKVLRSKQGKNVILENVSGNMTSENYRILKNYYIYSVDISNKLDEFESRLIVGKDTLNYTTIISPDTLKSDSTMYTVGYTHVFLGNKDVVNLGSVLLTTNKKVEDLETSIISTDVHEGGHIFYRNALLKNKNSVKDEMFAILMDMALGPEPKEVWNYVNKFSEKADDKLYVLASRKIKTIFELNEYKIENANELRTTAKNIMCEELKIPSTSKFEYKTNFQSEKFFTNNLNF